MLREIFSHKADVHVGDNTLSYCRCELSTTTLLHPSSSLHLLSNNEGKERDRIETRRTVRRQRQCTAERGCWLPQMEGITGFHCYATICRSSTTVGHQPVDHGGRRRRWVINYPRVCFPIHYHHPTKNYCLWEILTKILCFVEWDISWQVPGVSYNLWVQIFMIFIHVFLKQMFVLLFTHGVWELGKTYFFSFITSFREILLILYLFLVLRTSNYLMLRICIMASKW